MAQIGTLFTFTANTIIRSSQVNSNFLDIKTAYNAHDIATTDVHGLVSPNAIVGTTSSQTLTNKTITAPKVTYSETSLAAPYTISDTDGFDLIGASGTGTVTLPTLSANIGRVISIYNSSTGVITVDGEGTETIDGVLTLTLSEQYDLTKVMGTTTTWKAIEFPDIRIQDFTVVGDVGDTGQFMAGHTLTTDIETVIGAMIAIYNLSDNTDLSGNANTLDDADAYNAAAGILNVASTAHLGVNGEHLQADAISDFSGTGDLNISIGGWHKPLVSSGLLAVGTNAAAQKMQYYTDANGYVVFDIAGVTGLSSSYVVGTWTHIAMVYDQTNSVCYCYINGQCENVISATTNLDIQAAPSIWVNSKTDGSLEVASSHDEIFIYEGVMSQDDINYTLSATRPEPAALTGSEYSIVEKVQPLGDASYENQTQCQVVAKSNSLIHLQGYQYDEADKVKLYGVK